MTEHNSFTLMARSPISEGSSEVLGPDSEARTVFTGWISAIEAVFQEVREPQVVIFAEDKLMKLRMTRRTKTYERVTDADTRERHRLRARLTPETDASGPRYEIVQQWNMSDLAFLRERARRSRPSCGWTTKRSTSSRAENARRRN